jgi:hypothetical protein
MINNLKPILLSLSVFLFTTQHVFSQVKGWEKTQKGDFLIYKPYDIKKGKVFFYMAHTKNTNGTPIKDWLLNYAIDQQEKLGKVQKAWKVYQDKNKDWHINNSFIDAKSYKNLAIAYLARKGKNNSVSIVHMLSENNPKILLKYSRQITSIMDDASITLHDNSFASTIKPKKTTSKKPRTEKPLTKKEKRLAIKRAIRTTPGKGVKTAEIQAIWVDSWLNVIAGGISVNTYLLLKDGSVYTDLEIPVNELSVTQSKKLQPKKWTKWKKTSSGYQVFNNTMASQDNKKGVWKKLDGNKTLKPKLGEKLNATYLTASGSQTLGSHRSWITFKPNGRFELKNISMMSSPDGSMGPSTRSIHESDKEGTSSTTVISGKDVGGGTTSKKKDGSKNTGTYSIKGNTITLKHDNGYEHTELFFFDKTNKKSFILENERYWVDDRNE